VIVSTGSVPPRRSIRIAIVEDDGQRATQIQKNLNENSYSILEVFDGRDDLAAVRQVGVNVLVPKMSCSYRCAYAYVLGATASCLCAANHGEPLGEIVRDLGLDTGNRTRSTVRSRVPPKP